MGSSTVTGDANIETFEGLVTKGLQGTAVVDSSQVEISLGTRVEVTGVSSTASTGQLLVWDLIVPTQTPNFVTVGGTTAPPLQIPSWIDLAA